MPDLNEVRELLRQVHKRPRTWLPSSHYGAIVSFVEGLNTGSGGSLLTGFNEWLGVGSNIVWWGQIERQVTGRKDSNPNTPSDICARLKDEENARCVELLFRKLDEFLNQE